MPARRSRKVVFPADIHRIAAEIRRQALQHPEKDPVVPGAGRAARKRKPAKPARARRTKARSAKKTIRRRT